MLVLPSNEKELIVLLTESNEIAFEKLYNLYSGRILGYLLKFVKSETLACDLLQDTFVKIWNNRINIDPEKSFRSYLFRIAENLAYDFFRKAARDKKLQKSLMGSTSTGYKHVEENFCDKEYVHLLQDIIDALPPKRRQVFQLIKMEERSYAEVSSLLDISTSTVNDHVVKATKFIHEHLKGYQITTVVILIFFLVS